MMPIPTLIKAKVNVLRFIEGYDMDSFDWDDHYITLGNIKDSLNKIEPVSENYTDENYRTIRRRSKEWHIGRVKYFIDNPEAITPIRIHCTGSPDNGYVIKDGWHRFAAAIILELEYIDALFTGKTIWRKYISGQISEEELYDQTKKKL